MIKPNWDIFKAKFNDNPQKNFEWFCYLLFCQEFNKPQGIFRYKNQAGIETNPIIIDKEVIGWQAKFYDTTLSNHKIIGSITKSKGDYPALTKIIFYTNQDWGQGKNQNDPQAKIEAEEKAKTENIEIEWRTSSYFESPFVSDVNASLSKHFFTFSKSVFDLLKEKSTHTENVLCEIQTKIDFDAQKLEIDRSSLIQQIENIIFQAQIIIISGVGGVGKTSVIKKLYENKTDKIPFYVFKSNEFNINNLNELFKDYSFNDFVVAHDYEETKIIVIDSAEKLLDLQNTNPFKEFVSTLIKEKWHIIFTARSNYLLDLDIQFIDNYQISPSKFYIENLKQEELESLSQSYNFKIPEDQKLQDLIKNPFYLNEYLRFYSKEENLDYSKFKETLWKKIIYKSKPNREQCFLQISIQRANEGQFFVIPNCDTQTLNELVQDGILGYETAGYFITHDIYEEWALEKKIELEFIKKSTNDSFFESIGNSLPIRRAFRNWLSEKLLLKNQEVKIFIEEVIEKNQILTFWKDEILISVLLSDYSDTFFEIFKEKLLENNQELLKRLAFLLRIACKEVDSEFFKQLGIGRSDFFSIKYVLTKPKGMGWTNLISFVLNNLSKIGIGNSNFVLPIIHDWNRKFKQGNTTRFSSLIAFKYYQWAIEEDIRFYHSENIKEEFLQTILYGASEIKEELISIFEEIIKNKWKNHRDPYYDLIKTILTKFGDSSEVIKSLSEYVLKIADLFWSLSPKENSFHSYPRMDIGEYFCIDEHILDYFPASSYQSPIYFLLNTSLKNTIEFILYFTNKKVECYAKSDLDKNIVEEVEVFVQNEKSIKQFISPRLWNTYRGTQSSSYLLESIHMALEKFFLEIAEKVDSKILESWLLYLVKNSKSASISAIVTSIVLAYPEKTFNVAKILFQTKEFFIYDTQRKMLDLFVLAPLGTGVHGQLFQKERIESKELKHRTFTLEDIAVSYQFFKTEEMSNEMFEERQNIIWNIFENYYKELSEQPKETGFDKTWKLFLARMDRRKMEPIIKEKNEQVILTLNPKIDPELKKFSEKSIKKSSEPMKYNSLKLWANYKIRNDQQYKQFEKYEDNPKLAVKEVKKIVTTLKKTKDENFLLFNKAIPGDVCSVLIRDHLEILNTEESKFCKDVILEVASSSFKSNYRYQLWDGVESAISLLPKLLDKFPEEKETIKNILILTLFDPHPIGMYAIFSDFPTKAIFNELWEKNFEDAKSILFGYLYLKPKYEELRDKTRKENFKKNIHSLPEHLLIKMFNKEYQLDLEKIVNNKLSTNDLKNIESLDLYILKTAFELIPTKQEEFNEVIQTIINGFAEKLFSKERDVNYLIKNSFLKKLTSLVLSSSVQNISVYLRPFIDGFKGSEIIADMFKEFIIAEDRMNNNQNFWQVWELFYNKILELGKTGDKYWHSSEIIRSYLFAQTLWEEKATNWHTLNEQNSRFFKNISEKIGHCPSVLFSISKLLDGIGSIYLTEGVSWISHMLEKNRNLSSDKLDIDTIFYLENVAKKYIYKNREQIKKTKKLRSEILVILDFLVEKGSVVGYLLRENIL